MNLSNVEKLKASVEALDRLVTLAALRAVGAAVRQKVRELRALRPKSFLPVAK